MGVIAKHMYVKVFFENLVRAECVRQRNEVAIKLGIIFLFLSPAVCSKP